MPTNALHPRLPLDATVEDETRQAGQTSLIRTSNKDDFYVNVIAERVESIVRDVCGQTATNRHRQTIHVGVETAYLGVTAFGGVRTLGEEYTDIHMAETTSVLRRCMCVCLHTLPQFCVDYILKWSRRRSSNAFKWLLFLSDDLIPNIIRLHMILFFLFGSYLHFSKRLTGIKHTSKGDRGVTRRWTVALVLCVQIIAVCWMWFRSYRKHTHTHTHTHTC
eukprot:GHVR01048577.1.p1 GENE.GHVR01048577.1~~GHVR01048577.1.p1  ORF type:complete len:220 (-),score=67.63 GHVR01048577.1:79-738(-)